MSGELYDIPSLVEQLKSLVRDLAEANRQMAEVAPRMEVPLRQLISVTPEELDAAVERLLKSLPEASRGRTLAAFCQALDEVKGQVDHTKWRLDRRIQPEGKEREERPFKSFCKRKPEW